MIQTIESMNTIIKNIFKERLIQELEKNKYLENGAYCRVKNIFSSDFRQLIDSGLMFTNIEAGNHESVWLHIRPKHTNESYQLGDQ